MFTNENVKKQQTTGYCDERDSLGTFWDQFSSRTDNFSVFSSPDTLHWKNLDFNKITCKDVKGS